MASTKQEFCCAVSGVSQRCATCQDSCSCADGCRCSNKDIQLQTKDCAGNDAIKSQCGAACRCFAQCPCRKAGCAGLTVDTSLCSGTEKAVLTCTMPGNCNCSKGSVGKL